MPMDWEDLVTQIDAQLPKEVWAQTRSASACWC